MINENIFLQIKNLLKDKKINIDAYEFVKFFNSYKVNNWIYPNVIKRKFNIKTEYAYEILELCSDNGLLKKYLQILCNKCNNFSREYYEAYLVIDKKINCEHCGLEINNPLKHAIIIYKKEV